MKTNQILSSIEYWANKVGIKNLTVKINKRKGMANRFCAYVPKTSTKENPIVVIVPKNLVYRPEFLIQHIIFHELGHIYHDTAVLTNKDTVKSEYLAEKKGISWLKKYFPDYHVQYVKYMRKNLKYFSPNYIKAFSKIKDYQIKDKTNKLK